MEKEVVVSLFEAHKPVSTLFIAGPAIMQASHSRLGPHLYTLRHNKNSFTIVEANHKNAPAINCLDSELRFVPASGSLRLGPSAKLLRRYRGSVSVAADRDGNILCRNRVSMQDYISSVVGSESLIQFPEEALKAQSVLIQTAMLRYKINDDLNDSTGKQTYLGADYERPAVVEAVRNTWGKTLSFAGHPLPIYFHSTCAGGTSSSELFTGKKSGLACDVPVHCTLCRQSPFWKQTTHRIPASEFDSRFPEGIPTIIQKDKSDRPLYLEFASDKASSSLQTGARSTAYSFWLKVGQQLGWDKMPGTRYSIKRLPGGDIELNSNGAGHGVGLCQWGAAAMANKGQSYDRILKFYFPGSTLMGPSSASGLSGNGSTVK